MEKEYTKRIGDSKTKSLILPIIFAVIVISIVGIGAYWYLRKR